jgi:hypothetical protein
MSLEAFICLARTHLPLQLNLGLSLLTQSVLAIYSWLILKDTTSHILLKDCSKIRDASSMEIAILNFEAK